jgi:hypothetical protein
MTHLTKKCAQVMESKELIISQVLITKRDNNRRCYAITQDISMIKTLKNTYPLKLTKIQGFYT